MLINAKDFNETIMETLDYPMDDDFRDLVMRFVDRTEISSNMTDDEIQDYVYDEVSDFLIYYKDMWIVLEYYQWSNIRDNKLDFYDAVSDFEDDMIQVLIAIRDEIKVVVEDYVVIDIDDNQIYGEFDTYDEAEEFIDEDQSDHNLEIRERIDGKVVED